MRTIERRRGPQRRQRGGRARQSETIKQTSSTPLFRFMSSCVHFQSSPTKEFTGEVRDRDINRDYVEFGVCTHWQARDRSLAILGTWGATTSRKNVSDGHSFFVIFRFIFTACKASGSPAHWSVTAPPTSLVTLEVQIFPWDTTAVGRLLLTLLGSTGVGHWRY